MDSFSALAFLECSSCGATVDADQPTGLCACGRPMLARYDLDSVRAGVSPELLGSRPPNLWRYHELLPVRDDRRVVSLGEGMTPLLTASDLGAELGVPFLLVKDESALPTGTFKSRGAAVGVSRAVELGAQGLAMPTNGNAGAAWATYAARAGVPSLIVMPAEAPYINRVECLAAGAELYLVDGLISDAGRVVSEMLGAREGYHDVATLREPYRIEGKKTMGYEIVEQLGWKLPEVIVYPAGGGVGLIGIHKALTELTELGWVTGPMPRLVVAQASGCAPLVRAFESGSRESEPWHDAHTVAFGINVPKALGDFLVLDAVYATGGTAVAIDDDDLLAQQRQAAATGLFCCPEGAAGLAAVRHLRRTEWLRGDETVVVINTGTGLKYPHTIPADAPVLSAGLDAR